MTSDFDEALTPRHEAPAEPVSDRYKLAELLSNPQELEAPAEGAGEIKALIAAYERWQREEVDSAVEVVEAVGKALTTLRARSSAPESLGNLLAVIHRDGGHRTLEVGVERAAAEAEKIVADLLSSAPEAREGDQPVAWGKLTRIRANQFKVSQGDTYAEADKAPVAILKGKGAGEATVTHVLMSVRHFDELNNPAPAPSADKLRIAVEALEPFASIGQFLFARPLPDETPVFEFAGLSGGGALTRGMFKAAHTASRLITNQAEEGE